MSLVEPVPLGPTLSQEALRDYWSVYMDNLELVRAETTRFATSQQPCDPAQARVSQEEADRRFNLNHPYLGAAVLEGAWAPYIALLEEKARGFAHLDLPFSTWSGIVRAPQALLIPRLVAAFGGDSARLSAALRVTWALTDFTLNTIAREYQATRQQMIEEERALRTAGDARLALSERSLRDQTDLLKAVLEGMGDAVLVCDPEGRYLVYNRMAEALLGSGANGTVLDRRSLDVFLPDRKTPLPPEHGPLARALRGESSEDVEMVAVPAGKPAVFLSASARPLLATDGTIRGGVAVVRNITERKRGEEVRRLNDQLREQSDREKEANRLKSAFLASMSHELRTPLNAILGFTEILFDGVVDPITERQREYLGDVLTSGRHLLHLINEVLDIAKVEAGKMEFFPEAVDLVALTKEVCNTLRPLAASRHILVLTDVAPLSGPVDVDSSKLKQVLYNYLSNALKFTPPGGRVTVRVRPEGNAFFRLEVEDTGIGIRPEDIGKLFTEFQQINSDAGKEHQGTGLGLALTRRIVEAQGGRVGVHSVLHKGSVFEAVLPRLSSKTREPL